MSNPADYDSVCRMSAHLTRRLRISSFASCNLHLYWRIAFVESTWIRRSHCFLKRTLLFIRSTFHSRISIFLITLIIPPSFGIFPTRPFSVISEIISIEWKNLSRFYKRYFNAILRGNGSRWGWFSTETVRWNRPVIARVNVKLRIVHVSRSISFFLKRNARMQGKRILDKCRACRDRCLVFSFFFSSPSRSSSRSQSLLRRSL